MNEDTKEIKVEINTDEQVEEYTILGEFWDFLKHSKRWWLLPIIVIMILLSVFIALTITTTPTLIYTLF